jgi:hypothetical protein
MQANGPAHMTSTDRPDHRMPRPLAAMERNSPPRLGRRVGFGDSLRRLRIRSGKSRYRLWQLTGLDQAFLGRLEMGEKNPSRNTVLLLGLALVHGSVEIQCDDIDELLLAADYAPLHRGGPARTGIHGESRGGGRY